MWEACRIGVSYEVNTMYQSSANWDSTCSIAVRHSCPTFSASSTYHHSLKSMLGVRRENTTSRATRSLRSLAWVRLCKRHEGWTIAVTFLSHP